ncbi:hypothetical protein GUITHDRAFT_144887 [Guillardia theta CCMP2712]|uniref:PAS domain-containing protein n=1 Tax=Guillardia theta (strain CCMP2712) TaxID=905079 RepID=L1IP70_GUITC|nr:hypothetical protein GUITHDRAFT_144887 [Guillardia theta CCMP2712]EKX37615.1 hypothetical protein GUITHDRAFT_144887 [Guillardia theta CCMP2712]|eukprot:XP_005824595.1 hypothetical protein GUITHDRAFT_144887 [Guillardia theta CCMP2712]
MLLPSRTPISSDDDFFDPSSPCADAWRQFGRDLQDMLGRKPCGFALVDVSKRPSPPLVYLSAEMTKLLGLRSPRSWLGQPWSRLLRLLPDDREEEARIERVLYGEEEEEAAAASYAQCVRCEGGGGERMWVHVYVQSGARRGVPFSAMSCYDVTELVEGEGELEEESRRVQEAQVRTGEEAEAGRELDDVWRKFETLG